MDTGHTPPPFLYIDLRHSSLLLRSEHHWQLFATEHGFPAYVWSFHCTG